MPFAVFQQSDAWLSPCRGMAGLMLASQTKLSAMLEVNRKLADEIRDILCREQDVILTLSTRSLIR